MNRVIVVSDTHWSQPENYAAGLVSICEGADLIIHAGDAVELFVLDWLQQQAPLQAVAGNCDRASVRGKWPALKEFELGGVHFGLLHGHQVNLNRPQEIKNLFSPKVRFIIHGHTHLPVHYQHQGVQFFNPGSLSEPRGQRGPTCGVLRVGKGEVEAAHLDFDG